jgi:PadR family transcriptional regulator, regulatory protein PadR
MEYFINLGIDNISMRKIAAGARVREKIHEIKAKFLSVFLLWRLLRGPVYAYSLRDEIGKIAIHTYQPSTLYAVLSGLEKSGLVEGRSEEVNGRVRRMYSITAKGREVLDARKRENIRGPFREFMKYMLS